MIKRKASSVEAKNTMSRGEPMLNFFHIVGEIMMCLALIALVVLWFIFKFGD